MPRRKDPLRDYVAISEDVFDSIYKRVGNINGELKIQENNEAVKYFAQKKFLLNRQKSE